MLHCSLADNNPTIDSENLRSFLACFNHHHTREIKQTVLGPQREWWPCCLPAQLCILQQDWVPRTPPGQQLLLVVQTFLYIEIKWSNMHQRYPNMHPSVLTQGDLCQKFLHNVFSKLSGHIGSNEARSNSVRLKRSVAWLSESWWTWLSKFNNWWKYAHIYVSASTFLGHSLGEANHPCLRSAVIALTDVASETNNRRYVDDSPLRCASLEINKLEIVYRAFRTSI